MTLAKNKRGHRGIQPVVATIILIAVAVTIAAGVAGFSSSLFETHSTTPIIRVQDISVDSNGDGTMTLMNSGASGDSVASIQVPPNPPATPLPEGSPDVPPNSVETISFGGVGQFKAGSQVTMKIKMTSGQDLTESVTIIASPAGGGSLPPPCSRTPPVDLVPFC
ncbi:MAG: type IV pilin N-terminal domain-containing protein [Nitrososphaerales archaeon]